MIMPACFSVARGCSFLPAGKWLVGRRGFLVNDAEMPVSLPAEGRSLSAAGLPLTLLSTPFCMLVGNACQQQLPYFGVLQISSWQSCRKASASSWDPFIEFTAHKMHTCCPTKANC